VRKVHTFRLFGLTEKRSIIFITASREEGSQRGLRQAPQRAGQNCSTLTISLKIGSLPLPLGEGGPIAPQSSNVIKVAQLKLLYAGVWEGLQVHNDPRRNLLARSKEQRRRTLHF